MNSSGDFNLLNFTSLIENYESTIQDVAKEIEAVQIEQGAIRGVLKESSLLSIQLNQALAEKTSNEVEFTYKESDLVENLKLQLKTVLTEKDQAIKLWQNAAANVDYLEGELQIYQDNTENFVPKAKLLQLQESYEAKLNDLQNTVAATKSKLEETINLKSKELKIKDNEIVGTFQSQDNNFKIIKNLEEEVLKLQQRLSEVNGEKNQLEKALEKKGDEIGSLKQKVRECRNKVEEALQVVDAALNEKDAALLRETETKDELVRLSKSLSEISDETEVRIRKMKNDHEEQLGKMLTELRNSQDEAKSYERKCTFLEEEIERMRRGANIGGSDTSKLLMLEKDLENTFQKLLLSEKQNIQLKSEAESIKQDLDQMASYYERDIKARDAEKIGLQEEIKKLKSSLNETTLKASKSTETVHVLSEKVSEIRIDFEEQLENAKQHAALEKQLIEASHAKIVEELEAQLESQSENNKKWRVETKYIIEQLEKRIIELKVALNKNKQENKVLSEKLKEANLKMFEYKKFLEMISQDVNKITNITLPEIDR